MDTRDTPGTRTEQPPLVVVASPSPGEPAVDRPVLLTGPAGPPSPPRPGGSRRGRVVGLVVLGLAGVVALVVLATWLARGTGDVSTTPAAPAPKAAPVAPLTLRVDVPPTVVAGRPAALVVHYDDGAGVFSGGTEDWGDQVGASSLSEGTCSTPAPARPARGSYAARHAWAKPGTYPVRVAVSTYTCVAGAPVVEQASTTVQVVVAAP